MAKKIKIQHLYTTGSTSVNDIKTPTGLTLGEIAIDASPGFEDIKILNGSGQTVSAINGHKIAKASYFDEFMSNPSHEMYGHVVLSDVIEKTNPTNPSQKLKGVAASIYHTHDNYISTGDTDYQNMKIFLSGATFDPEVVSAATDTLIEIQNLLGNGETSGAASLINKVTNIEKNYISKRYSSDNALQHYPNITSGTTEIGHISGLKNGNITIEQQQNPPVVNNGFNHSFRINVISGINAVNGHISSITSDYQYLPISEVPRDVEDKDDGSKVYWATSGHSKDIGLTRLYVGDLSGFSSGEIASYQPDPQTNALTDAQKEGLRFNSSAAASIYHFHSQYLEATSVSKDGDDIITTISCGTY